MPDPGSQVEETLFSRQAHSSPHILYAVFGITTSIDFKGNQPERATHKEEQKPKQEQLNRHAFKIKSKKKKKKEKRPCTVQMNSGTPSNTQKEPISSYPPNKLRHLSSIASEGSIKMKADTMGEQKGRKQRQGKWSTSHQTASLHSSRSRPPYSLPPRGIAVPTPYY